jgi:hypothetical protein
MTFSITGFITNIIPSELNVKKAVFKTISNCNTTDIHARFFKSLQSLHQETMSIIILHEPQGLTIDLFISAFFFFLPLPIPQGNTLLANITDFG